MGRCEVEGGVVTETKPKNKQSKYPAVLTVDRAEQQRTMLRAP